MFADVSSNQMGTRILSLVIFLLLRINKWWFYIKSHCTEGLLLNVASAPSPSWLGEIWIFLLPRLLALILLEAHITLWF